MRVLLEPRRLLQGVCELLRRPGTFGITWKALKKYRAIQDCVELSRLLRLLRPRKMATVLEIGTEWGGTLYAFSQVAADDATIVSIDYPPLPNGRDEDLVARLHSCTRARQRLVCLRMDSHREETLDKVRKGLDGRGIDFCFIDGDHTYDGARADFEMYGGLVEEGGLIAFHDIVENSQQASWGVHKLWREIRETHECYEFIAEHPRTPGMGIGVLVQHK
ncbi:class I SAM-dependent methyltransferase [Planctomycetota bacterium]